MAVSDEEFRETQGETTVPLYSRGVLGKYAHLVSSAAKVLCRRKPEETGKKVSNTIR